MCVTLAKMRQGESLDFASTRAAPWVSVVHASLSPVIERSIDFERSRWMRCGACSHAWIVSSDWLSEVEHAVDACPVCGADRSSDGGAEFCTDPEDPVHDDSAVRGFAWYHSTTHERWPDRYFDPAAGLTADTRYRMEALGFGEGAVERWAERQKAKALHVGTYEAAVENMLRRMQDQADALDQFYLYRVQLEPDCIIQAGVHREPTNWVGDAYLADICAPGTNVLRYVNVHEDQSSVSLAIELSAVRAVQRIPIPLTVDASAPWVASVTQRLIAASCKPMPPAVAGFRGRLAQPMSPLRSEARVIELEAAANLPPALRERINVGFIEDGFVERPSAFPMKVAGIVRLVTEPRSAHDALDAQPWHNLNASMPMDSVGPAAQTEPEAT